MVVLCVATLWVTTKNAPFSDRNKSFQTFLKTFEIASGIYFSGFSVICAAVPYIIYGFPKIIFPFAFYFLMNYVILGVGSCIKNLIRRKDYV